MKYRVDSPNSTTLVSAFLSSLFASLLFLTLPLQAQESITVDYSYSGNANLSSIRPSLRIADFTDSRGVDNPNLVVASGLGNAEGLAAEAPLADIVRDAFVQAFTAGGVDLVESGEEMIVAGEVTESQVQVVERDGVETIQLTIRTSIELQSRGRTVYDTNLYGRGNAPLDAGLAAAVHAALDRMVRDLTNDDYFMIELM